MDVQGESVVILSDDAAMSVGDSDEEESESDGFSCTDSNSSHGESTRSHGSRKRPADESPEREWDETRRREFPGIVTRSEGGCLQCRDPGVERSGEILPSRPGRTTMPSLRHRYA